jgi:predicted transcriptional regulator
MPFQKGNQLAARPKARPEGTKAESILVKRARAANIISLMAQGYSQTQIAEHLGITRETIRQALRWAEREGFFERAEDAILHRLAPLAIDALEAGLKKAIESGETDAALKLLEGLRMLSKGGPSREQAREIAAQSTPDEGADEITWERFTAKRKRDKDDAPPTNASRTASRREIPDSLPAIDAQIVRSSDGESHDQPHEAERGGSGGEADGSVHERTSSTGAEQ